MAFFLPDPDVIKDIFDALQRVLTAFEDAMSETKIEFYNEGYTIEWPDHLWIMTPTGLCFDIMDITEVAIGALYITCTFLDEINIDFSHLKELIPFVDILTATIPGSNAWYFSRYKSGIGFQWPPQVGSSYDPSEYYGLYHYVIDNFITGFVIGAIFALSHIGLARTAEKIAYKVFGLFKTGGNVVANFIGRKKIEDIYNEVNPVDEDEEYEYKTLRQQLVYMRNYINSLHMYILNPVDNKRPKLDLEELWIEEV